MNWVTLAGVHQPWKYFLFGDLSLRIGGVSGFQKNDFAGTYQMNHDGGKGTLTLWAEDEDYIEGLPPIGGTYTGSDGKAHMVRGFIRTWQYPLDASWGPDYHINFTIDFYDTYASSDDQLFSGYLFTGEKDVIAGKTWWNSIPFGFYAIKGGTTAGSDAPLTEEEQAFLEQAYAIHEERRRQFLHALDRTPEGVVSVVFDATDRIQHMFFRDRPDLIDQWYEDLDRLVGRIE